MQITALINQRADAKYNYSKHMEISLNECAWKRNNNKKQKQMIEKKFRSTEEKMICVCMWKMTIWLTIAKHFRYIVFDICLFYFPFSKRLIYFDFMYKVNAQKVIKENQNRTIETGTLRA